MSYTVKEFGDLLKIAKKSKVKEFKLGELHVVFFTNSVDKRSRATTPRPPVLKQGLIEKRDKLSKEALLKQELETKQEQLEEMLLTNPLQYEELLLSGELIDEREEVKNG